MDRGLPPNFEGGTQRPKPVSSSGPGPLRPQELEERTSQDQVESQATREGEDNNWMGDYGVVRGDVVFALV